ncbi:MAG: PPC domain-containing DNA-binding protein [Armatimonadota bacterium]
MKYTQGSTGRVFLAKLDDGESVYDAVMEIARNENVKHAAVWAVGGMRSGKVVSGPEDPNGPVVPVVYEFDDARELVGFGTLVPLDGQPSLHFHAAIGHEQGAMVVCPRIEMHAYLVLEVVILEMMGLSACREYEARWDVHTLSVG